MSNKKNHNTIYFLTTLSVYLGLIVVGSSPQILAQIDTSQQSQTQRFEIRRETSNVFSGLKLKKHFELEDVLPHSFVGSSKFNNRVWTTQNTILSSVNLNAEIASANNQVFTVSILPRASI